MAITPYLLYEDVESILEFLSKAFGFEDCGETMRTPEGRINHAAMKLGNDIVMMGSPGGTFKNPKRLGQSTVSLYVTIDNVDKHCKRAKKAGAKIIEEPIDTFYGHRRYGVEDPEGHQWYFAHELKKVATKKITKKAKKAGSKKKKRT